VLRGNRARSDKNINKSHFDLPPAVERHVHLRAGPPDRRLSGRPGHRGVLHLAILKARRGSGHGYDVVDHSVLNPEIGGPQRDAGVR
jgi:hypothetical protein